MKFCIITHVSHINKQKSFYAYAPYVREMNIWLKYVENCTIVAPLSSNETTPIDLAYTKSDIEFITVPQFNFLTLPSIFKALFSFPIIVWKIYSAMKAADHIHIRCPGNMGLLGCVVQIFFPKKQKTVKYAGNWDPQAKQPFSYKVQKWIVSNTFLTKNCKVLVYGEWEHSSINCKSFFTASYFEKDKVECLPRSLGDKISFLFVGTLSNGKQPLYAIQLVEKLFNIGYNVELILYGDGIERTMLEQYVVENKLNHCIFLKGNQAQEAVKTAYTVAHFVILPSKSEGWPKVVAEAMFWGCLPIATKVSCVPNMLDKGKRGLLLDMVLEHDVKQIEAVLVNENEYQNKVSKAITWSRTYTLDLFENEIKKFLEA